MAKIGIFIVICILIGSTIRCKHSNIGIGSSAESWEEQINRMIKHLADTDEQKRNSTQQELTALRSNLIMSTWRLQGQMMQTKTITTQIEKQYGQSKTNLIQLDKKLRMTTEDPDPEIRARSKKICEQLPISSIIQPNIVISRSQKDINNDGLAETVEIVLKDGIRYNDDITWCGSGEKWDGFFLIRVKTGEKELSCQSLGKLFYDTNSTMFFMTPEFSLVFQDYNGDGQPDFNLGQYGCCNGWQFHIFTIQPDGGISRLTTEYGLFISASENSTNEIYVENNLVKVSAYYNSVGKHLTHFYKWDGKRFACVKVTDSEGNEITEFGD